MITLKAKNFQENRWSQAVAPWSVKIGTPDPISIGANTLSFDAILKTVKARFVYGLTATPSVVTPYKENEAKPYVKSVFLAKMTCANASPTLHSLGRQKMNMMKKTCATCRSFDPVHGCWVSVNLVKQPDVRQAWLRPPDPKDCCKDHQTQLESDAQDLAVHAFWRPLLIKSREAAGRTMGPRYGTDGPASDAAY